MGYMEGILTLSIFVIIVDFFAKYMELNVSLLNQRFSTSALLTNVVVVVVVVILQALSHI